MIFRAKLPISLLLVLFLASCEDNDTAVKKSPPVAPSSPSPPPSPPSPPPSSPISECGNLVTTGYTNKISYFPGETIEVFLQSQTANDLGCGLGFYDIRGNLAFRSDVVLFPQTVVIAEPWEYGFNFVSNGKVILPLSLASGIYFIENQVSIIVKSTTPADIVVVYPSNTINAYNAVGGKSLYSFNSSGSIASTTVSFLRPVDSPVEKDECIKCLQWFPSLANLKIKYVADIDLDDYYSLLQSKIIMIVGHSEYWTRKARTNFDRFVNEGGHAIILSGNTMWWQVRYTPKKDALICYRNADLDPEPDIALKTTRWIDPSLQFPILPSIGEDFEGGGYGTNIDKGWDGYKIFNPSSPLLEGLTLEKGEILKLPSGECDGAPIKDWDVDGFPILNNDELQAFKLELIGFDRGTRGGKETIPTFIAMQKTPTSGIIVNVGSINWCSLSGMGSQESGDKIKTITRNAIDKLLSGESVFSD